MYDKDYTKRKGWDDYSSSTLLICADCSGTERADHAHHWFEGDEVIVICEPCAEERANDAHILNSEDNW